MNVKTYVAETTNCYSNESVEAYRLQTFRYDTGLAFTDKEWEKEMENENKTGYKKSPQESFRCIINHVD